MMEVLKYLKARYIDANMSEKAQGMVEYALVLAFVVGIGWFLLNNSGLGEAIEGVFTNAEDVTTQAASQSNGH